MEEAGHCVRRVESSSKLWPCRLAWLVIRHRPRVLFLQKVMPPAWFLRVVRRFAHRMVFDLDDAVYFGYPGSSKEQAARTARKILDGTGFFDAILTSNRLIRRDLGLETDPRCVVFPGPSPEIFETVEDSPKENLVLWLGSPSTISNVDNLLPALRRRLPNQEFLIIGSANDEGQHDGVSRLRWTQETEAEGLRRSWSGLMPLERSEWNDRKAGYKILEYLRSGVIPVVEDTEIVRTLLGANAERLCELVAGSGPDAWADAIARSLSRSRDTTWLAARDDVFAAWSTVTFSQLILGTASPKESV